MLGGRALQGKRPRRYDRRQRYGYVPYTPDEGEAIRRTKRRVANGAKMLSPEMVRVRNTLLQMMREAKGKTQTNE